MRVTAVLTTCDRPGLLERALRSVFEQTRAPDDILVINDGTSPVHPEGVRVQIVGPYAGPGAARNSSIHATTTEWLAFLDDDDEWDATYLEEALALGRHADVVLTAFEKVDRHGELVPDACPPAALVASDWLTSNPGLRGSNLFIRRETLAGLAGFDEVLSCGEDVDLAIRLADHDVRYARNPRPRVRYHSHDGPRLTRAFDSLAYAHRTFLALHGHRMSPRDHEVFCQRTRRLFDVDPGPIPRLTWVLGPPGAGKTTWARRAAGPNDRVVDIADVLFWRDGADKGVLTAKRHVIDAIRAMEQARDPHDRRLFVTGSYMPLDVLEGLAAHEHVVTVMPSPHKWTQRLTLREGGVEAHHQLAYNTWLDRCGYGPGASLRVAEALQR